MFHVKNKLKGKPIYISENLTKTRHELLKAAIIKFDKVNVWSCDGRITTKINNSYVVINNLSELANL